MIKRRFCIHGFEFSIMDVVTLITGLLMLTTYCLFGYWLVEDAFFESSSVSNLKLEGSPVVKPGSDVRVSFVERRFRSCTIQIGRFIRRVDRQPFLGSAEYQVQFLIKAFRADPHPRLDAFDVQIPQTIPPGDYVLVSRIRYYCDILDSFRPRVMTTEPIPFRVVGN